MKVPVSVLIPVRNEESQILDCLRSVNWADEIVTVDSQSTDATVKLVQDFGARCVQFHYQLGGPKKRNWSLENVDFKHEWILIVDADERIPEALAKEIAEVVSGDRPEAGYYINRRLYFMGRWIMHCGYYPSWNLRLFKRHLGRYEQIADFTGKSGDNEAHQHLLLQGKAGWLVTPMDHYAYPTTELFLKKHIEYANWEASLGKRVTATMPNAAGNPMALATNRRRTLKRWGRYLPFPHWTRFFYHYFLRLGVLDGVAGYILCHLLAEYEFLIWAKTLELGRHVSTEP